MILDNKDKLTRIDFNVNVADEKNYKLIIHNVWKDSLNLVIFIRYEDMIKHIQLEKKGLYLVGNPLERKVRKLISPNAENEFDLKMDTKIKKPELYKKNILVKIEYVNYKFKISGAGDYAIKLSLKIPYKDITIYDNPKKNPLENKLKNIIYYICSDKKKTWDMNMFQIMKLLN